MPEWTICPRCSLKHRQRLDALCPRCKEPLAGEAAPRREPMASGVLERSSEARMPDVYDGRAFPGSSVAREAARAENGQQTRKMIVSIVMSLLALHAGKLLYRTFLAPEDWGNAPPPGVEAGSPEHLRHAAEKINTLLPKDVDSDTRLTRVYARDREFVYEMELTNYSSRELDSSQFLAQAQPFVRSQACGHRGMKGFWKHGITATYRYLGNDRVAIGTVSVSPRDCG